MTNEELDKARASEAWRLQGEMIGKSPIDSTAMIAARLAREGWTPPPPPVDPDLLAVREIVARIYEKNEWYNSATHVRQGRIDEGSLFGTALAAYKAGREAEAERAKVLLAALDDIRQHGGQFDARKAGAALNAYNRTRQGA